MKTKELDTILSDWGVQSEAERWSLKTQFLEEHSEPFTTAHFEAYLRKHYGTNEAAGRTTPRHP